MKKLVIFVVLGLLILLVKPHLVTAQTTCDLCGFCANAEPAEIPENWGNCATCLYGVDGLPNTLEIPPDPNKSFTVFGCITLGEDCDIGDTDCNAKAAAAGFSGFFMNFLTTIVSGIAFLGIVYGGFRVMLAKGDPDGIREGKRYVYGSILGLLIVMFSVFIVKIVGGNMLQIPYLQ